MTRGVVTHLRGHYEGLKPHRLSTLKKLLITKKGGQDCASSLPNPGSTGTLLLSLGGICNFSVKKVLNTWVPQISWITA